MFFWLHKRVQIDDLWVAASGVNSNFKSKYGLLQWQYFAVFRWFHFLHREKDTRFDGVLPIILFQSKVPIRKSTFQTKHFQMHVRSSSAIAWEWSQKWLEKLYKSCIICPSIVQLNFSILLLFALLYFLCSSFCSTLRSLSSSTWQHSSTNLTFYPEQYTKI